MCIYYFGTIPFAENGSVTVHLMFDRRVMLASFTLPLANRHSRSRMAV